MLLGEFNKPLAGPISTDQALFSLSITNSKLFSFLLNLFGPFDSAPL